MECFTEILFLTRDTSSMEPKNIKTQTFFFFFLEALDISNYKYFCILDNKGLNWVPSIRLSLHVPCPSPNAL